MLSRSNWATLSCSVWLRPWPCGHSVPGSASSVHAICSLLSALPSLTRGKRIVSIELLLLCLAFNPNKFYAKTSVGRLQSHLFEKIVSWVWQGIGWGAWLWKVPCGFVAFLLVNSLYVLFRVFKCALGLRYRQRIGSASKLFWDTPVPLKSGCSIRSDQDGSKALIWLRSHSSHQRSNPSCAESSWLLFRWWCRSIRRRS